MVIILGKRMAHRNLFHNASLKLASVYLVIILFISLLFSFGLYSVSSNELKKSLGRPISLQEKRILGDGRLETIKSLKDSRQQELEAAQDRLQSSLIAINILIAVAGGGVSYILARRTLQPIEEAHEVQSRFTADASHELRTPIAAMRIETEVSLMDPKLSLKAAKKQLESNIEELDKLTHLSEGLLQLARLDSNSIDKSPISVEVIILQAMDRILKEAEKKKQIITIKNKKDTEIEVNQMSIVEALVTLLDNAVKYSPDKTEIVVTAEQQSKMMTISVSDTGIGIKASELPYVFNRFYRADSARTNSGRQGYGIGLSIARSIAEAHNGNISVKSKPSKGSTFTLSIPAK